MAVNAASARSGLALVAMLLPAACEVGEAGGGVTVRDSAGIHIVESSAPHWNESTRWRVEPEPMMDLGGGTSPAEPYLYQRIIGVMRLTDGRLLVADGQAAELRFYDGEGRHLRTVGGRGDGPGELEIAYEIWRRQGDTLVVSAPAALHEFAPSGDYVRSWRPPGPAGVPEGLMNTELVLGDGSLILTEPLRVRVITSDGRAQIEPRDSTDLYIAEATAPDTARFLLRHPSRPRVDGRVPVFAPTPEIAGGERHVIFGMPDDFALAWYGTSGGLERIVRRAWEPVAVGDDAKETYRASSLADVERMPEAMQAGRRQQIAEMIFASRFPAFDRLLVDRLGNLWVRLPRTDGVRGVRDIGAEWSVFDTSGIWLGDVTMPTGIDVREIGDDYVAAVWQDELDVHHARLYRLSKP